MPLSQSSPHQAATNFRRWLRAASQGSASGCRRVNPNNRCALVSCRSCRAAVTWARRPSGEDKQSPQSYVVCTTHWQPARPVPLNTNVVVLRRAISYYRVHIHYAVCLEALVLASPHHNAANQKCYVQIANYTCLTKAQSTPGEWKTKRNPQHHISTFWLINRRSSRVVS